MAINFPNNPGSGEIYTEGNKSWQWLGNRWGAYNIQNPEAFAFRNKVINGDMRIDQRNAGALVVGSNATRIFGPDRFFGYADNIGQSFTVRQLSGDGPADFNNYFRFNTTTGNTFTTTDQSSIQQRIEGFNAIDLRWGTAAAKTITVSFWVRASIAGVYLFSTNARSPFTRNYTTTYTVNAVNTWEYKTITIPGDTGGSGSWLGDNNTYLSMSWSMGTGPSWFTINGSNSNWVGVNETNTALSTHVQIGATTGATFDLTGVQLEKGPTATPFEHRPIGTELTLCQRYYQLFSAYATGAYPTLAGASASMSVNYPVPMRDTPIITTGSTTIVTNGGTPAFSWSLTNNRGATLVVSQAGQTVPGQFGVQTVNNAANAEL